MLTCDRRDNTFDLKKKRKKHYIEDLIFKKKKKSLKILKVVKKTKFSLKKRLNYLNIKNF